MIPIVIMAKWKKDQKQFSVSVFYDERRGSMVNIPKPILEELGEPNEIIFEINKNKKITLVSGDKK